MSELLALGVSHKTAPLDLRERLALTEGKAAGVLGELRGAEPIAEAAAVSTCNRSEIYLVTTDPVEAESLALATLARESDIRPTELVESLYSRRGIDAARHLFQVASGLDSMILGEAEIQGQIKRAYELALVEGATGPILNRLFRGALATGKRVRSETRIGEGGTSVPSAAVELASRSLGGRLGSRRVLLIGAGETAELTAKALAAKGVEAVFVANRRYDRAIGLAERFGGSAVRFDELPSQLAQADIVVSSTNSPHHIIEREELELMMRERDGRPLLFIDLAVPRDIDPACQEVEAVGIHDVDDVQTIAERNAGGREAEARRAERIVSSELSRLERWLDSLEVLPTVAAMRGHADRIVARVLDENAGRWRDVGDEDRERIEALARAVASRILHEPTLRLKRSADSEDAYLQIAAIRNLFGLDATTEPEGSEQAEVTPIRREDRGQGQ
ncbi:MAG TPA: glutamyl-tRNA reductase [Solirubrobacterales bacterium]|nr:glutamyl-tRNA reductase [Solirubrobacterales bacterium]